VWAGTTGQLDDIPVGEIRRFEGEFLQHLRSSRKELLDAISSTNRLEKDTIAGLTDAITNFKQVFSAKGDDVQVNDAPAKALEGGQARETVTRQVRKSG
jgi:F-type H+-transporting ATPase subunit alpha